MTRNVSGARSPAWNPYTVQDGKTGYMELLFPWQLPTAGLFKIDEFGNVTSSGTITPGNGAISVISYGADPTGVNDSTAAIQAAIDASTGTAAPASNTRGCAHPVYLPAGQYKVTADLVIRSTAGFAFYGDGPGTTLIVASGTGFTKTVLLIDGAADGLFGGFAIQGDGTEQVTDGIRLDFTAAAFRSTTGNRFKDIRVRALKFVNGFSLQGNGSKQLDGTIMDNVIVTGSQTPGSWTGTGNWQYGFVLGDGTYANNYDHVATGCSAALCYTGWLISASSLSLNGSQPAGNRTDFNIMTNGQTSIRNVQTQNNGQFILCPAQGPPEPTTVEDITIFTVYPLTGAPIATLTGGLWQFKNIDATFMYDTGSASYKTGTFAINGTAANKPVIVNCDNVCVNGTKLQAFPAPSNARISVRNFSNYNTATGLWVAVIAGDISSIWSGTWTVLDGPAYPAVLTPSFAFSTAAQLSDTTRDYMVMMVCTNPGTGTTIAIGPTSTPANTILPSSTLTSGEMFTFRLPAGWYVLWTRSSGTAFGTQTAIAC